MYQVRFRREGFIIEVASKDFNTMKRKFLAKLAEQDGAESETDARRDLRPCLRRLRFEIAHVPRRSAALRSSERFSALRGRRKAAHRGLQGKPALIRQFRRSRSALHGHEGWRIALYGNERENGYRFIECTTEKTRKGYADVRRRIPISPMLKRVWEMIDFEKAKAASKECIRDTFKAIFPDRHPHELRYTFISRCKEHGCNLELVMLWDGHQFDKDVASSKVDRGYTQYSDAFYFGEIEKVNYDL